MAVSGHIEPYAITAAESWSDARAGLGHIFKAIDLSSRQIANANNGQNPAGILQGIALNAENAQVAIAGVSKYVAAAAISVGAQLRITTSGYMTTAGSGFRVVGRNLRAAVASGAVGQGVFYNLVHPGQFEVASGAQHGDLYPDLYSFTAQADLSAAGSVGKAVDAASGDFPVVNQGTVVLVTGTVSGGTSYGRVTGVMSVRAGNVIAAARGLAVAASGWFIHATSGDRVVARALEASAAANSGSMFRVALNMAGTTAAWSVAYL